jgi:lysophospholipase L1-like esterase
MPHSLSARPLLLAVAGIAAFFPSGGAAGTLKFDFGSAAVASGYTGVAPDVLYSPSRGYGFEPGALLEGIDRGGDHSLAPLERDFVTSERPFHFTAHVPHEGNYRVTVTLGDATGESRTTIKAELRRLMAERVATAPGRFEKVSFIVNTRTPRITAVGEIPPGEVRLKAPRESIQEAWAWDNAITLEFGDSRPAVCAVEIEPADVPTLFLLGDSTVCDQSKEPYNSWGQMLTRFFTPAVALANHGESGETYRDSIGRRRLDKILSVMQPGDWLLMQFGHNDQKQIAAGSGGPFTTYAAEIRVHVAGVRARGGHPVIVSPMERRGFAADGSVLPSLEDYAAAARQTATELNVPFIDLNTLSRQLYAALGPDRSARAFAATADGKIDNTHHNNYGSYQLAQCIVQAIRELNLPIAKWITPDFRGFDPRRPDDPDTFSVPASGDFTNTRPLGE